MVYKFVIRGSFYDTRCFPGLNEYLGACNKNYRAGGRMKKEYGKIASAFIRRDLGRIVIKRKVDIHYSFFEPDKRRDKGNIAAFADKVICDSLQECGVIKNDGWNEIGDITYEFHVSDSPRIEVTLTEV